MPVGTIKLPGFRLNGDWVYALTVDRLFYKNAMVPTPRRPLCLLRVLIDAKRDGDGYVTNKDFLRLGFPGVTVSAAAVSPNIDMLRERFGADAIPYHRPRGYILDMVLEELDPVPADAIDLPDYPDAVLGRVAEMEKGLDLIGRNRLVTLIGPGGIGKTRLGVALARQAAPHFPDGARFADLAPVKDMATLPGVVAAALRVPLLADDSPAASIANGIGERKILLVADTCEYLIKPAGGFFTELLARAQPVDPRDQPGFGLAPEKTLLLKGLAAPPPEATAERKGAAERIGGLGAVALFVRRAKAVNDEFALTDTNAADIAAVCRQVGGHPLSIELVAARAPFFGTVELRSNLDKILTLPADGPNGGAERHLSLRQTIDWSHGQLDAAQQQALRRLGIFPASFTMTGAWNVTGEEPSIMIRLAEHSMLRLEETEQSDTARYRLHESQQLYARDRLKESGDYDATAERCAQHLKETMSRATAEWEATPDAEWLRRYGWELDNLPAALEWAFADSARDIFAIDLSGLSARLFDLSGRTIEGRRHVDRALKRIGSDTPPASAARLLRFAGILWRMEDRKRAVKLIEQAADLYREIGDRENLGVVLGSIGKDWASIAGPRRDGPTGFSQFTMASPLRLR